MINELDARLANVRERIRTAEAAHGRAAGSTKLITVSKTFDAAAIEPAIRLGERHFGENRVQEAQAKWPALKYTASDRDLATDKDLASAKDAAIDQDVANEIVLHLIGPLQSNKAKDAVALFDAIHTVDRDKIAAALAEEIARQSRSPLLFVQVNTGLEPQKAGVAPRQAVAFVERCREAFGLAIAGLMCIPPAGEAPGPHFALLQKIATEAAVPELSMGMSGDFETAIAFGATYVRVGGAIFGRRPLV